ncbi:hypothetical protein M011DRAFT_337989 [Sporormia fimetaria CBS 119925]|uniref:Uncharacterized protein n=1 Tax=Sporormia fimetaria CBS 119925 TaxID=1340428 RepID=A0A6A6VDV0_9PLEO|nr:hypothetical protein M011DRAFT_337989 [Sporormia fimetaria CBS 119925]
MSGIVGDTTTGNSGSTETSGLPKASSTPNNPSNVAAGDSDPLRSTDKTGVISGHQGNAPKTDVVNPTSRSENPGGVPDSGATPQVKHQGIDQPTDKPTGEQQTAIRDSKNEAEELLKKRDPNDHSGEPMKMHDGSESAIPNTQAERRNSKAGMPGGQEHGKDPKGTGEQWVKTSGTAADGGDFDATKPGAGREADRMWHWMIRQMNKADMVAGLMEEKGIKRSDKSPAEQPATATAASPSGTKETKEKESLSEKLKHKLHIGHSHRKA